MSETVRRRVHERRPELISDALQSYLIDSHGSGSSARPADLRVTRTRHTQRSPTRSGPRSGSILGHCIRLPTAPVYAARFLDKADVCVAASVFDSRARW